MVFLTGLPASGKSLLLRQLVETASLAGRRVHILRWDAALAFFEAPDVLAKYPGVEDGTHPMIRRAAGLWGRETIARWATQHSDASDMFICEVPIIGNRYSEFVEVLEDDAESLLASDDTVFLYPIPTPELRDRQEGIRRDTFTNPSNPDEAKDAPPSTMDLAWRLTFEKALELGLISDPEPQDASPYDAGTYQLFFDHLLRHRNAHAVHFDTFYAGVGSAHDLQDHVSELTATPEEVADAIDRVEAKMTPDDAAAEVARWYTH